MSITRATHTCIGTLPKFGRTGVLLQINKQSQARATCSKAHLPEQDGYHDQCVAACIALTMFIWITSAYFFVRPRSPLAQRCWLQRDADAVELLVQHTVRKAQAGQVGARQLANVAYGAALSIDGLQDAEFVQETSRVREATGRNENTKAYTEGASALNSGNTSTSSSSTSSQASGSIGNTDHQTAHDEHHEHQDFTGTIS